MDTRQIRVAMVLACWLTAGALRADGQRDNDPARVRPVPPPGVTVPADARERLEQQLGQLRDTLRTIEQDGSPQVHRYAADVAIFVRAVQVALEHDEFFQERDVATADELLHYGAARASQILAGDLTWTTQPGPLVRGFVSRLDGSVQPYGLWIPPSYSGQSGARYRLDIWLHGRGESTGEVAFLGSRLNQPSEITPTDTLVLHPYGRYSNAFKFAGEVDVLEALDHVNQEYRVDSDRIAIRGFSMGGAGCWQFAVHYPDRWFAANPGAGFCETPEFLRTFQGETLTPTPHEERLWRWYDCPGYARNLLHCPTIAYSGELDRQKQAADRMEAALKDHDLVLQHIVGPQTDHSIHADSKLQIESRLASLARAGRERNPQRVEFATFTLKYSRCHWVQLDALHQHWERASVVAERSGARIVAHTENVDGLTFDFPAGDWATEPREPVQIVIDATTLTGPRPSSDRSWHVTLHRSAGKWTLGPIDARALRKRVDLQGPIDDAFMDAFLFVIPTGPHRHAEVSNWSQMEWERSAREWRRQFRGVVRTKLDVDVTQEDAQAYHLVLWGAVGENQYLQQIMEQLPIRWTNTTLEANGKVYDAAHHVPALIYPNPRQPSRYVVVNSGFTFREFATLNNARQVPVLPDWAVIDTRQAPSSQYPGRLVAAGFFDETWQWQH